jgi:hypothetical protein
MTDEKLNKAFAAFDAYNEKDPNREKADGKEFSKEVLYALRMTKKLNQFVPEAPEHIQLAARCQHIGRWEIERKEYPMDRVGYLKWREAEKKHHAEIATKILTECGYDENTIAIVSFLLLKKQLHTNPDTQLLEDVVCLVFVEHYLEEFAAKHEDDKIIDILKKTLKKMSPRAIEEAVKLIKSEKIKGLLAQATQE